MGLLDKARNFLGLIDGHEDRAAKRISKKTGISEDKVRKGIDIAQDNLGSGDGDDGSQDEWGK